MTDRELMQQVLDALEWNLPVIEDYGHKEQLHKQHKAIATLRARLEQHEPVLVTPYEFVKQVEGKENMCGRPVMMSVWPMQEWGDSQVTNPEFVAEQKAMNEALRSMAQLEREPPEWCKNIRRCMVRCDNCPEPLWIRNEDGKLELHVPPQREWQGLTDEEIKNAWSQLWYDLNNGKYAASDDPSRHTTVMFARAIEAKLKEKNEK